MSVQTTLKHQTHIIKQILTTVHKKNRKVDLFYYNKKNRFILPKIKSNKVNHKNVGNYLKHKKCSSCTISKNHGKTFIEQIVPIEIDIMISEGNVVLLFYSKQMASSKKIEKVTFLKT